jgi:pimeloyl-ACP methyl ester carboxylesterase
MMNFWTRFFARAVWWLVLAEGLLSALGWRGLTILGQRWSRVVVIPALVAHYRLARLFVPAPKIERFAARGVGLAAFLGLAVWRQRARTPATVLTVGERNGRRVSDVQIAMDDGYLPGLLVEPLHGSKVGVLVLHGAGANKSYYSWPLLFGLTDAGFAACAVDVDGHGDNPRVLDFPSVLDDVVVSVRWLRERYGHVAVVGISQGGCIAARAIADGVEVDALVLMEAPITVNVTKAVERREMRTVALPATWALHRDLGTLGMICGWYSQPVRTKIGTVDLIERLDIVGSVARVKSPLLLCYARNDAVVPVAQARTIAAAAPANTPLVLLAGATHLSLPIDGRAIRHVARWLALVTR